MFKKMIVAVFCFALLLGVSSMAMAKADEKDVTVVEKMAEPKGDLKEKIGLAFSTGGTGSMRLWLTKALALDLGANLSFQNSTFGLGLAGNIVFPMMETASAALYAKPGLGLNFSTGNNVSDLSFMFVAVMEAEAFIVKDLISVGGSFGLGLGVDVASVGGTSTTNFIFGLGTDSSPASLFVRVYL